MTPIFQSLTLELNVALFAVLATGVWFAGSRLSYLADALSDRLKLARSMVGLLALALATSLPEVATTLSAAAAASAELVLNNLFGGIALQTAILALADFWARGAITNYPRKANHALEATLLVALLSICLILSILGEPHSVLGTGLGSVFIGTAYAATVWLLRHYDEASDWVPVDLPDAPARAVRSTLPTGSISSTRMMLAAAGAACIAILSLGIALVGNAEALALQSGLGDSFVGVTLLAGATSLPELSTTITAVRLGAYTMAISNIFGSNLIMIVLVLPADLIYRPGPILRDVSVTVQLAICFGILVTGVYIIGLIVRRKPRIGSVGIDSVIVLGVFMASVLAYYTVR